MQSKNYIFRLRYSTVSFTLQAFAINVAKDELAHVVFLRTALGAAAVPIPLINLGTSFSGAADAALNMTLKPAFSPYAGDLAFLLGSFIFEDVGVTAYKVSLSIFVTGAYFYTTALVCC